ncbi:MAG: hypothetical protein AAFU85_15495 [Planctomycetota bacterium]
MLSSTAKPILFLGLAVLLCDPASCRAGLIVSLDGLALESDMPTRIRVLVEHDGVGSVPTIDSFSVRLAIEPILGVGGGGELRILDDGESLDARNDDPAHVFAGKGSLLFSTGVFNDDQEIEVIDSVGLFDTSAVLSGPRLLTAFNLSEDPLNPLLGGERFQIRFNETDSVFFDGNFTQIRPDEIVFRAGTISTAVPEPSTMAFGLVAIAACVMPRRRRASSKCRCSNAH